MNLLTIDKHTATISGRSITKRISRPIELTDGATCAVTVHDRVDACFLGCLLRVFTRKLFEGRIGVSVGNGKEERLIAAREPGTAGFTP